MYRPTIFALQLVYWIDPLDAFRGRNIDLTGAPLNVGSSCPCLFQRLLKPVEVGLPVIGEQQQPAGSGKHHDAIRIEASWPVRRR